MKVALTLDAVTKAVDVEVTPGAGFIRINDLRIGGMSGRALRTLRNALISAVGFPEGQDLDELDLDAAGLTDVRDKITAYLVGSQQTTAVDDFDDFDCPCISSFAPRGTKCSCGGTARTF